MEEEKGNTGSSGISPKKTEFGAEGADSSATGAAKKGDGTKDASRREGGENMQQQQRPQQPQQEGEEEQQVVIEQPLLTIKEVFVYMVPPLRAASGHRAEEWGLANPVFTGGTVGGGVGEYLGRGMLG